MPTSDAADIARTYSAHYGKALNATRFYLPLAILLSAPLVGLPAELRSADIDPKADLDTTGIHVTIEKGRVHASGISITSSADGAGGNEADREKRVGESLFVSVQDRLLSNTPESEALTKVGERVLRQWPLPLRGYAYTFGLVHSDTADAVGYPAGKVIVTDELLRALTDSLELEAILAHEIAHVELQHRLKEDGRRALMERGFRFFGVLRETLQQDGGRAGRTTLRVADKISEWGQSVFAYGHLYRHEIEADIMATIYMLHNYGHTRPWSHALKVLARRAPQSEDRATDLRTHARFIARQELASTARLTALARDNTFECYAPTGAFIGTISLLGQCFVKYEAIRSDKVQRPSTKDSTKVSTRYIKHFDSQESIVVFGRAEVSPSWQHRTDIDSLIAYADGERITLDMVAGNLSAGAASRSLILECVGRQHQLPLQFDRLESLAAPSNVDPRMAAAVKMVQAQKGIVEIPGDSLHWVKVAGGGQTSTLSH